MPSALANRLDSSQAAFHAVNCMYDCSFRALSQLLVIAACSTTYTLSRRTLLDRTATGPTCTPTSSSSFCSANSLLLPVARSLQQILGPDSSFQHRCTCPLSREKVLKCLNWCVPVTPTLAEASFQYLSNSHLALQQSLRLQRTALRPYVSSLPLYHLNFCPKALSSRHVSTPCSTDSWTELTNPAETRFVQYFRRCTREWSVCRWDARQSTLQLLPWPRKAGHHCSRELYLFKDASNALSIGPKSAFKYALHILQG